MKMKLTVPQPVRPIYILIYNYIIYLFRVGRRIVLVKRRRRRSIINPKQKVRRRKQEKRHHNTATGWIDASVRFQKEKKKSIETYGKECGEDTTKETKDPTEQRFEERRIDVSRPHGMRVGRHGDNHGQGGTHTVPHRLQDLLKLGGSPCWGVSRSSSSRRPATRYCLRRRRRRPGSLFGGFGRHDGMYSIVGTVLLITNY